MKFNLVVKVSLFWLVLGALSCTATKKLEKVKDPFMTFETPYVDLGVVKKGEKKEMLFYFTNTHAEPIEIEIVSGCNCSSITWPENKPIYPGQRDLIKVIYDSNLEEELGPHNKVVDILLKQTDPVNGYPVVKEIKYDLVLEN
ncbi:MAG: DUF1573 domain-containing protein [Saprospiraceae bacterium]|nr:DUF1573 domain-containing protein [Saprospiraceae bacterium]